MRRRKNGALTGRAAVKSAVLALGLALVALPAAAQTFEMKLATNTLRDPTEALIGEFKTRIEARSNGRIKAGLYPGSQLGTIPRMVEGVQLGTIEYYATASGFFKTVNPAYQALDVPGLFDDMDHANRTFQDPTVSKAFFALGENRGMVGATIFCVGPTSYSTRDKPLRTVADFKGMKFRVLATRIETGLMDKLGATGVPIPLEETLPALQNRLIDGVRSNIIVTAGLKYFSVAKYLTLVNDTQIATIGMVSTAFLAKLPPDLKQMVLDVAGEMSKVGAEKSVEFDARSAKVWRDNGAEVLEMVPAERTEFMRRGREVADGELKNNPDAKTAELYALLTGTAERLRKK